MPPTAKILVSADRGMAVGRVTAPPIEKEIVYRLLVGEQGTRLRQNAATGSHSQQIARAIGWLQVNFTESIRVEDLAARAGMSASAFHHHFSASGCSSRVPVGRLPPRRLTSPVRGRAAAHPLMTARNSSP